MEEGDESDLIHLCGGHDGDGDDGGHVSEKGLER
jgi:hypothetical protein